MLHSLWQVALFTYKESLRQRILYGALVCAVLLMLFALMFSGWFMRDILKIILDLCLAAVSLGGLLVPFFVAINLVAGDIDQKTIFTILAQPIDKGVYIFGKFTGLALLACTIMVILTMATLGTVWGASLLFDPHFLKSLSIGSILIAISMKALGVLVLIAVAMLWSTLTTSTFLATLLTLFSYMIGQSVETVVRFLSLQQYQLSFSPLVRFVAEASLYVFPNLAAFDFQHQAAYGLAMAPGELLFALVYGVSYTAALLVLAVLFFSRRDLP
ncbi:MAG: ABC transporter permease subunit [Desulfobulbaceae bacterium]|nr:ABC transporter permease subunit [Desulfobulbaceae bacterium]